MKIVACIRTLNEAKTVERFGKCYTWADEILISDGGSTDNTIYLARNIKNSFIYHFQDKIWLPDKTFYNPRGKHINFLIDWAIRRKADWIIFDDCDCVPTLDLQLAARNMLESTPVDEVFAYRMFVLGSYEWFPDMNAGQSLWAWRAEVPVRADEQSYTIGIIIPERPKVMLEEPYTLLHYFYPDEETLQRKKRQYVQTGEVNADYSPRNQFGNIAPLPDWARWE